jgi:hypothetical protein
MTYGGYSRKTQGEPLLYLICEYRAFSQTDSQFLLKRAETGETMRTQLKGTTLSSTLKHSLLKSGVMYLTINYNAQTTTALSSRATRRKQRRKSQRPARLGIETASEGAERVQLSIPE